MNEKLKEKTREALTSVLPITIIVLVLSATLVPMEVGTLALFLTGAVLLIVGMGFFQLGAEISMTPLGQGIGGAIVRQNKTWLAIVICFAMGAIITISEPDLQVLANQVAAIPNAVLIWTVAAGVGVFTAVAVLRILYRVPLAKMLLWLYLLLFVVSLFVPKEFLAVAFDAGGVTTGPMTVPFIMALGVGVCAVRSDKQAGGDSFGLVALCSIGPIITVLILGLLYKPDGSAYTAAVMPDAKDTVEMFDLYLSEIPHYLKETASALLPIGAFLILFQLVTRRLKRKEILHMVIGLVYVYIGLTIFLMGVNVGFMPVGSFLGGSIASHTYNWILIPIAMVIGYFIVQAEPAVHVLNKQVEEITAGSIPAHAMNLALSVGVAISLGLAMIRVLTGISIMWFLVPGYVLSLALSFVVPQIFTSVAFDSGGVASGPMTATFLLPFALGACDAVGGNLVTDAFGVVAMVAMTPLVTIQLLGLSYQRKLRRAPAPAAPVAVEELIELC